MIRAVVSTIAVKRKKMMKMMAISPIMHQHIIQIGSHLQWKTEFNTEQKMKGFRRPFK